MTRVAVISGGHSAEREVSLRSGHRVTAALRSCGYDAEPLDPADGTFGGTLCGATPPEACYVALHGRDGEDGTVQRLLETAGIPYTGSRPVACRTAFDKVSMKETMDAIGVQTPAWDSVSAVALRDLGAGAALPAIVERVGLPLVVKPARAGSAMGVSFVDDVGALTGALMNALSFSDAAVLERRIEGVEVAVGLLEDDVGTLPPVEVVPRSGVFDYAARYTPGATEYFAPARIRDEWTSAALEVSRRAFEALGVRDVARADLLVDAQGRAWIVDVNVSPGMTETSLLPLAGKAVGISFEELCERILRRALDRG